VENAGEFLIRMLQHNPKLLDHSSFTSLIAVSIAKQLKLNEKQQAHVGMGCLFMDVGITRLDLPDYYTKVLAPEDQSVFERHPMVSVEMLTELESQGIGLPEDVFSIALQHHERFNGHGFPNRRRGKLQKDNPMGIHPLACIVALAERFTILFKENEGKILFKPVDAFKLLNRLREDFDPIVLTAFNDVVGYDSGYSRPILVPII
jgi:HD-GYP domain-containing protein (c-di-GMP phosphodiesterase class II)